MNVLRVLLIEDSDDDAVLLVHHLKRAGWELCYERVDTREQMEQMLNEREWDIILCDYVMPSFSGLEALKLFQAKNIDIPFLVISGKIGEEVAVEAMKAGANDYILKQKLIRLIPAMERELNEAKIRKEKRLAQQELSSIQEKYRLIAENMSELIALVDPTGVIQYASPSFNNIDGATIKAQEYQGRDILGWVVAEDQVIARQILLEVSQQKVSKQVELKIINHQGAICYYEVSVSPIFSAEGNVSTVLIIARDIHRRKSVQEELRQSEERYRRLVEMSPEPVIVYSDGFIVYANSTAAETLRAESKSNLLGRRLMELVHPEYQLLFEKWCKDTDRGENLGLVEQKFIRLDGIEMDIEMIGTAIPNSGKYAIMILFHDISVRKKAEKELRLTHRVFENSLEAIVVTNQNGIIQSVNPAFSKMTGYSEKEAVGKTPRILKSSKYPLEFYQDLWKQLMTVGIWQGEIWNRRKNGEIYPEKKTIVAIRDMEGNITNFSALSHDISQIKEQEAKIKELSNYDMLTGLPNRRHFEQKLNEIVLLFNKNRGRFALYYLDLDRFKYVNDSLGYLVGDQLLQSVANRLQTYIEYHKGIVSRIGGDEFSVLLPNVKDRDEAIHYAERLCEEIAQPFFINGYELFIKASIGISLYPTDGEDTESLLKNTDIAMYWAKERHHDHLQIFTNTMNIETYKTFSLEKDLRSALANHQFELFYQPRVEIKSGKIVGAESLIRWNHPEWGLVSPLEFIPLAEETGLILEIEEWVKKTTCEQIIEWQQSGLPRIPISINVFAQTFMKQDFMHNLQAILEQTGVDGKWVEIEITESFMIQNAEIVRETIGKLKEIGIKISLDDFGTGYSSLSYLTQFAIDILKIDKSFIMESTTNSQVSTILFSIIQMAHGLNMEIVAEGVETEEQLQYLNRLHCHYAQGYLFSPPVSANEFKRMLAVGKIEISSLHKKVDIPYKDKRKFFRIDFFYPLATEMTIIKIKEKNMELGKTEVLIEDIGLGGIRILSHLKLAVLKDIVFKFGTQILGEWVQMYGYIVWKREIKDDIYQYGVEFIINENERTRLAKLLNKLSVELRKSSMVKETRFIKEDKISYIKAL